LVDKELLNLIVCPDNRTSLSPADGDLLAKANAAIDKGSVRNRGGDLVSKPLEEALLREDGAVLYPVVDAIPVLLADEGIETRQFE